uniref:Uncharacterized protein LOC117364120 n=1 Tax=Geotrypetes seraphini TaxID=260995 RepID=A0A6P8RTJ3_GEOSA|nr:uncharacterized protein LOC117364120 [Geotrypetes seraphini]
MSDPVLAAFLTKLLCAKGGRLALLDITQHLDLSPVQIFALLSEEQSRFLLLEPGQDSVDETLVLPLSPVRICNGYLRQQDQCQGCDRLHLCRFFVLGKCRFRCRLSHDIHSECNIRVRKANEINGLNEEELRMLLLQNDPSFLTEICPKYKGSEQAESCPEGNTCKKLHICRFFSRGQCRFFKCKRSHNLLDPLVLDLLQVRGLRLEVIQNVQLICDYRHRETCREWTERDPLKRKDQQRQKVLKNKDREKKQNPIQNEEQKKKNDPTQNTEEKKGSLQNKKLEKDIPKAFTSSRPCEAKVHVGAQISNITFGSVVPIPMNPIMGPVHTSLHLTSRPNVPALVNLDKGPLHITMPQTSKSPVLIPVSPIQGPLPNTRKPETSNSMDLDQRTLSDNRMPDSRKPGISSSVNVPIPGSLAQELLHTTMPQTSKSPVLVPVSPIQGPLPNTRKPETTNSMDFVAMASGLFDNRRPDASKSRVPSSVNMDQRMLSDNGMSDTRKSDVQISKDLDTLTWIPGTNKADVSAVPPQPSPPKPPGPEEVESSNEICLFNVWKFCKNTGKCPQMHFYLPYRWQILQDTDWKDLPTMEEIEKAYCDPNNISSGSHNIDFKKMTCAFNPVRRLSTASSVTRPTNFQLTTEWLWYWKNEHGQWIEYGKQSENHKIASLSSFGLENVYLADKKTIVPFQAGSQSYEINFADMVQKNVVYRTEREICRRPKFLSYDDVLKTKMRKPDNPQPTSPLKTIPLNWDKAALPDVGFLMVAISSTSSEYKEIQKLFEKTMSGYSIQKMNRIQNPSLWEVFQWQKDQMKKLNGGKEVCEKMLFHGTDKSHMDAICHNNFDWRICGVHGTMYGKGSYFARDASYSHNYCLSTTSTKSMFVARVLVGDFTQGVANYLRPPNKSFRSNTFYDSCVDKVSDPSIFVVFEKHQIYPEYILQYAEEKKCCIS